MRMRVRVRVRGEIHSECSNVSRATGPPWSRGVALLAAVFTDRSS